MLDVADIKIAYNNLYKQIRKYMWEFPAVEALADLEVECYKTCPSLDNISKELNRLYYYLTSVISEDDELKLAYESLRDIISSNDTTYSKLGIMKEVQ